MSPYVNCSEAMVAIVKQVTRHGTLMASLANDDLAERPEHIGSDEGPSRLAEEYHEQGRLVGHSLNPEMHGHLWMALLDLFHS